MQCFRFVHLCAYVFVSVVLASGSEPNRQTVEGSRAKQSCPPLSHLPFSVPGMVLMETAHRLMQRAEDSSAERDGLGVKFLEAVYKEKARKMVLIEAAHRIVRRPENNLSPEGVAWTSTSWWSKRSTGCCRESRKTMTGWCR